MKKVKRRGLAGILAMIGMAMMLVTACGAKTADSIEVSDKKITLFVGETADIDIENYDDLGKITLEYEVDDDDIVEITDEYKDGFTIEALEAGKTVIVVSGGKYDDVEIKVTVKEEEPVATEEPEATEEPAVSGTSETEIIFAERSIDLDYSEYKYQYIENWDSTWPEVRVYSTDEDILYATWFDDGSIGLSNYGVGDVVVKVEADGFPTAQFTVHCTNNAQSGSSSDGTATLYETFSSDYWELSPLDGFSFADQNSDGTVLWYTSDSGSEYWVYGDLSADMYYYLHPDETPSDFDFDYEGFEFEPVEIGTAPNGNVLYMAERISPNDQYGETDMFYIFFPYDDDYGTTDYVVVEFERGIVRGWSEADYRDAAGTIFNY